MTIAVNVTTRFDDSTIAEFVRERLELVVGRFSDRVTRVDAILDTHHGTKCDDAYSCALDIHLSPRGHLRTSAENASIKSAAIKAIHRAEAVIARKVESGHRRSRIRHRGGGLTHDSATVVGEHYSDDLNAPEIIGE
jgi:hypothetical protein